jgi:Zn-dependent alcohol dehydrogenase
MAKSGRVELKKLITSTYPYEKINEALEDLEHGRLRMGVSLWN